MFIINTNINGSREAQVPPPWLRIRVGVGGTRLSMLRLQHLLVRMNVRHLCQREGLYKNSLPRLYPPVHWNKSLWLLLIFTLLLLLHLQPLLLFQIQKAPATPTFMDIPTPPPPLVLSIPDPDFKLIPSQSPAHQKSLRDEPVWIYPIVVPLEVDRHQPTPIENLINYSISITLVRTRRMFVLSLIHTPIRFLVTV